MVHRDSLVVKREGEGSRALLSIDEAPRFGANPGTIFLGLRDGAAVFGMGISTAAVEKLMTRDDVAVTELRGMAMQGVVPPEQLSAIAMAKSMVSWHQRHGFCANCGTRTAMKEGGWKRDCPNCKAEHFPRTDPVVIMLVTSGDKCCSGGRSSFRPACIRASPALSKPAETIEDAVRREILEESGIRCTDVNYYMTQPWPYPSSLMIGCTARATSERYRGRPHGAGRCALVRPRRGPPDDHAETSRRPGRAAPLRHCPSSGRALGAWGNDHGRIARNRPMSLSLESGLAKPA